MQNKTIGHQNEIYAIAMLYWQEWSTQRSICIKKNSLVWSLAWAFSNLERINSVWQPTDCRLSRSRPAQMTSPVTHPLRDWRSITCTAVDRSGIRIICLPVDQRTTTSHLAATNFIPCSDTLPTFYRHWRSNYIIDVVIKAAPTP